MTEKLEINNIKMQIDLLFGAPSLKRALMASASSIDSYMKLIYMILPS